MQVQVALASVQQLFTNLDFVTGKVILTIPNPTDITSITAKLEGDLRTRLLAPARPELGERPRVLEETHKLLYNVATVFPPNTIAGANNSRHYTLNAGRFEYPFSFKMPFNNTCHTRSHEQIPAIGGFRLEAQRPPPNHVKGLLPPTLTSFPGMAEVKYYIKVTVSRREFYKENHRSFHTFNFLPIEPPRPAPSGHEMYARRTHEFPSPISGSLGAASIKRPGFLDGFRHDSSFKGGSSNMSAPKFSLEARLPNPAIITCNQEIPLRLILKRLDDGLELLSLLSVHIEIIGTTQIRCYEAFRKELTSWVIMSRSNMNIPLQMDLMGSSSDETSKGNSLPQQEQQAVIDSNIWRGKPLPPTIAPTFESCALARSYELVVKVGIGYGRSPAQNATIIDLLIPVTIYSGIAPPAALLSRLSMAPGSHVFTTQRPSFGPSAGGASSYQSLPSNPSLPPRPVATTLPQGEEEPPPRYEDAIASDLPPIEGPRSTYSPPAVPEGQSGFGTEKRGSA